MEIWKTIKGFEDYQVSNFGNVKSLKFGKEKLLKQSKDGDGYLKVNLHFNSKKITKKIHKLVSLCFLNDLNDGLVVDHIDNNPLNNNLNNLQLISNRLNISKNSVNKYSKLIGVSFSLRKNKYKATISHNNKNIHLGYYTNEIDASIAYNNKLKEIDSIKRKK